MSKVVEAYNYKIGLDVSSLKAGGVLTRAELGYLRRDFGRLQEPGERATKTLERLHNAYAKGGIDAKVYAEAVQRINAKLPENIAAQNAQVTASKEAEAIKRKLITEEAQYGAELKRVADLIRTTNLTRAEAAAHLRDYKSHMPSAIAAQREQADAERSAAEVRRSLTSETERYAGEQQRLQRLVDRGGLSQDHANDALRRYRSQLPSVAAAERERAAMQRSGADLTLRYATAAERLTQTLAAERRELERLHRAGAISNTTYQRGRADLTRRAQTARPNLGGSLSQISALSGVAGRGASLVAMGPQLAALAVTIGSVVVAYKAASAVMTKLTTDAVDQAKQIIELERAAKLLHTDIGGLIAFQYAAKNEAGMEADASLKVVTKLSAKISEAAAGGGDALATLEYLGLSAQELSQMDPAKALREVVQAASEIENPIDRSRVAMKLFEEEGIAIANVLEGGAAGLDAAAMEAERLGLMVSDVDAAGIRMASQSVGELEQMWQGLTRQLAVEFAPVITATAETLASMLPVAQEFSGIFDEASAYALVISATIAQTAESVRALKTWTPSRDVYGEMLINAERARQKAKHMAEKDKRDAAAVNPDDTNAVSTKTYEAELKQLKERNMLLRRGEEGAHAYNLKNAKITPELKAEIQSLRERNKLLEMEGQITDREASMEKELDLANQLKKVRADQPQLDEETAKQRAELQLLEATDEQLRHHLKLRRDLIAIEEADKAREKEVERIKTLKTDSESLRKSYRLPNEVLAEDFRRLDEMRTRDLLTTEEHARAKKEATEAAMAENDPEATRGVDVNDAGSFYAVLVEQQQADRKAAMQRDEAERLRTAAEELNTLAANRLATEEALTKTMEAQVEIAGRIAEVEGRTTDTLPRTSSAPAAGTSDAVLNRIATAAEATATALSEWQIVGV